MNMQRERDESSIEESDPFLGGSTLVKSQTRSHRRQNILLYCLICLLGVSLGSHVLTYLYIHKASYLDAACVRHTQENREFEFLLFQHSLNTSLLTILQLLLLISRFIIALFFMTGHFLPTLPLPSALPPLQRWTKHGRGLVPLQNRSYCPSLRQNALESVLTI